MKREAVEKMMQEQIREENAAYYLGEKGWKYLGCGQWHDPKEANLNIKYLTFTALGIQRQRDER
jgi:hypothetical protein